MHKLLSNQELAERIKRGPCYLLLGQAWLKSGTGHDAFLEQALRKFGNGNFEDASYTGLFQTTANVNQEEAVAWLHDRCNSIPIPEAFETISEFAWNGVLTSAIDDVLIRDAANRGAMYSVLQKPSTSQQILEAVLSCTFGAFSVTLHHQNRQVGRR